MTACKCTEPNPGCENAKPKGYGDKYYCSALLVSLGDVKAGNLRIGQKFAFKEGVWLTNTVTAVMSDRIVYAAPCGTTRVINDLERIIELR